MPRKTWGGSSRSNQFRSSYGACLIHTHSLDSWPAKRFQDRDLGSDDTGNLMTLLRKVTVFAILVVVGFALVFCWDVLAEVLPFAGGSRVLYGVGAVVLFLVLFRRNIQTSRRTADHGIGRTSGPSVLSVQDSDTNGLLRLSDESVPDPEAKQEMSLWDRACEVNEIRSRSRARKKREADTGSVGRSRRDDDVTQRRK